jgi:hypothetical protein
MSSDGLRKIEDNFLNYFAESAVKKINVPGHTVASLTIWDIPGREDMDLHKTYFRDLDAAIGIFTVTGGSHCQFIPNLTFRITLQYIHQKPTVYICNVHHTIIC